MVFVEPGKKCLSENPSELTARLRLLIQGKSSLK